MTPTVSFDNLELHKPQKCRKARISGPYTTPEHPLVRTRAEATNHAASRTESQPVFSRKAEEKVNVRGHTNRSHG
jgi:hypothetical protein